MLTPLPYARPLHRALPQQSEGTATAKQAVQELPGTGADCGFCGRRLRGPKSPRTPPSGFQRGFLPVLSLLPALSRPDTLVSTGVMTAFPSSPAGSHRGLRGRHLSRPPGAIRLISTTPLTLQLKHFLPLPTFPIITTWGAGVVFKEIYFRINFLTQQPNTAMLTSVSHIVNKHLRALSSLFDNTWLTFSLPSLITYTDAPRTHYDVKA